MASKQSRLAERGRIVVEGFDAEKVLERQGFSGYEPDMESEEGKGRLEYAWQRFKQNRLALFGALVIAVFLFFAVFARPLEIAGYTVQPFSLVPEGPDNIILARGHEEPVLQFPLTLVDQAPYIQFQQGLFGTDWAGRDVLSRVLYGGRWTLLIGFTVVSVALLIGVPLGAIAGYYGGYIDEFIMRFVDMLYAFPFIVLAIAIIAVLGRGLFELLAALILVGWLAYARIIRGEILSIKEEEYIKAAKALGARDRSIIFRHIVPNAMAPVIVQATLSIGTTVLAAAGLGFIGLGLDPGTAEWGVMLDVAQDGLGQGYWWPAFFPGMAIFLFVMAINLLGDGVRDAFDPRGEMESSGEQRGGV